jgi:hypothetical protein
MVLTRAQADACQALLDVLYVQERETRVDPEEDFLEGGTDDWGNLEDDEMPPDDPDDEIHHDGRSFFEDDTPFAPDLVGDNEIAANPIQAGLLRVLVSLFTHLPSGRDDKFWSPVIRFIVLYSIQKNGKWLPARLITQIFAALLFCGRLLMMALMHQKVLSDPEIRYAAYVVSLCLGDAAKS